MAPAGGFSVTPGHYNAQYDYEFRQKRERVSYAEVRISECLASSCNIHKQVKPKGSEESEFNQGITQFQVEANRRRIKRWLNDPNASFTTQPS